jgi:hypothetical protein
MGVFTILVLLPLTLHTQHLNKISLQGKELVQNHPVDMKLLPLKARNRIQVLSKKSIHKTVYAVQLSNRLYEEEKLIL